MTPKQKSLSTKNALSRMRSELNLPRVDSGQPLKRTSSGTGIAKRIGSLLGPRRGDSPRPLPSSGLLWEPEEPDNVRDSLPETKPELEVRLNYHLSELDRLKGYVVLMNQVKAEHEKRLSDIEGRATGMEVSVEKLRRLVEDTSKARKRYGPQVGYHRFEVERITDKWLEIQERNGDEPVLPEVVKNLPNEFEWKALFLA